MTRKEKRVPTTPRAILLRVDESEQHVAGRVETGDLRLGDRHDMAVVRMGRLRRSLAPAAAGARAPEAGSSPRRDRADEFHYVAVLDPIPADRLCVGVDQRGHDGLPVGEVEDSQIDPIAIAEINVFDRL